MTRPVLGLLVLLLSPPWASAVDLSQGMFAFGLPIETPGAAAAYRSSIPAAVYRGTAREDLGDIRVFNGDGRVVASSLRLNSVSRLHAEPVALLPMEMPPCKALRATSVRCLRTFASLRRPWGPRRFSAARRDSSPWRRRFLE